jgi:uncharacterized protein involved in exopolysaccharide biosynthesis
MIDQKESEKDRFFIVEFFDLVLRWRRLLFVNTVLAGAITLIVMLLFFPNWYKATTSIMPPEKDTGSLGLGGGMFPSGLGALLGGSGLALPGLASPSDLHASILRSRSVTTAIIEKHNLKEVFSVQLEIKALEELYSRITVEVQAEGIITLSYKDTDPFRAAVIANSFIEELNRVNTENLVSRAAIAIEEQFKAAINTIATLKGELVLAEIELGVMAKSFSPDNPRFKNQLFRIEQIRKKIEALESGGNEAEGESALGLSMEDAPELALEFLRLTRELQIQTTIFELLKQQYEHAKIQEMRDTPTVQVLDEASEPELKSEPKRVFTAILGGVLSFGLTLFLILLYEFTQREKEKDSELYRRISNLSRMLNDDIYWFKTRFSKKDRKDAG